jgi:hypothetical protein
MVVVAKGRATAGHINRLLQVCRQNGVTFCAASRSGLTCLSPKTQPNKSPIAKIYRDGGYGHRYED